MYYFIAILFHFCFFTFIVSNATITNGGGMIQSQSAEHVPTAVFHNVFHAAKSVTNYAANSLRNWGGQNNEGVHMNKKNEDEIDRHDSGFHHDTDPEDLAENSFKRKIGVILLSILATANLQSIPLAIKYAVGNQNDGHSSQSVIPENNLIQCQPFYGQFACDLKIPAPSKEYLEKYGMLELYADIDSNPAHMEQLADIDLSSCEQSSKGPEHGPHIQHKLKNKIANRKNPLSKHIDDKHNENEEILCEKMVEISEKQLEKIKIKKIFIPKEKKFNNKKEKNYNEKMGQYLDKQNRQLLQDVLRDITNEDGMIQSQTDRGNGIFHRHSRKLLNWWGKKNDESKHPIQVQKRKFVADMDGFQKFVTWKNEINPRGEKKAQPSWSYDYGGRKMKTKPHPPKASKDSIAQPPENSDIDADGPSSYAPAPNDDYDLVKIFKTVSWRGILTFNLLLNSAPNEVYIRNNNVFQGVRDPIWCHPFVEKFKCTIELYPKELGVDPKSPLEIFMDLKGDYVTVQKMAEIDISECKSTGKSVDGKDVKECEGLEIIPEEYGKVLPVENPEKFITD